jgi:hypothetical protein
VHPSQLPVELAPFIGNWFLSGLFSTDDIGEVYAHETLLEKLLRSTLRSEHSGSGAAAPYCLSDPATAKVLGERSLQS